MEQRYWLVLWLFVTGMVWAQDTLPEGIARIHYQRPDGAYQGFELHVWEDTTAEVSWAEGLAIAGQDDYGVYYDIPLQDNASRVGFIVHKGDNKDPGPDMFLELSRHGREVWLQSGSEDILSAPPLAAPAEGTARIHYYRPDGDYTGFTLHVWEDSRDTVTWATGLAISGESAFGVYWDVALAQDAARLGFIVHRGDEKDPGPDMFLDLTEENEAWILSGSSTIYTTKPNLQTAVAGDLSKAQAYWLKNDLLAWDIGTVVPGSEFTLHSSSVAGLELLDTGITGGDTLKLTLDEAGLPADILEQFPHLAAYSALRLEDASRAFQLLRGQLAVSVTNSGSVLAATGVQIAAVLDDLYARNAYQERLGAVWSADGVQLSVWAPTAQTVKLHLFEQATDSNPAQILDMQRDAATGIWNTPVDASWQNKFYLYEVTVYAPSTAAIETNLVTDPYSVNLTMNSSKSQLVNLDDAAIKPEGWDALKKEGIAAPEDITIYELHVRDFSVYDDSVAPEQRGTYLAFTNPTTSGMQHLQNLADAGLSHLHLLPTFDIATINEDKSTWQTPLAPDGADLASLPAAASEQQAAIDAIRDADPYNWGYDPYHYNVPEGAYATQAEGTARILEYRQMVQALASTGLYVVNDMVYNHTNSSGQNDKSVLDKIVPGYYHRLSADGLIETSTCCQNTASEHAMMEKLMVDSVVLWAKQYKIDGFRFDLMGHHMVRNMLAVRNALDLLTLENDGVDGKRIYLYGEGWNFGEVADGARGFNATQLNLAGTGIGTYNDRLRDAVRGGGPFDEGISLLQNQGFINGAYYLPNEAVNVSREVQKESLLKQADQIRVGLAGNLADYVFENRLGETVKGSEVDYNGQPAGYTADPQENIVYISKHDNQTLWDISQYKLPQDTPMADRVRAHNVGMSIVMLAQGVPFFQAGDDLLRSKSLDRNSYNSGDWFNKLDFSYQNNNFGVGLPPARENRSNWQYMRPLLADPDLKPGSVEILTAAEHFQMLLTLRRSSKLFRLETAAAIHSRLSFHNTGPDQTPGVIIMSLSDTVGDNLDPEHTLIVVLFNATNTRQTVIVPELAGLDLRLHPLLQASSDEALKTAAHYSSSGSLSVPAFTTAVFVEQEE